MQAAGFAGNTVVAYVADSTVASVGHIGAGAQAGHAAAAAAVVIATDKADVVHSVVALEERAAAADTAVAENAVAADTDIATSDSLLGHGAFVQAADYFANHFVTYFVDHKEQKQVGMIIEVIVLQLSPCDFLDENFHQFWKTLLDLDVLVLEYDFDDFLIYLYQIH